MNREAYRALDLNELRGGLPGVTSNWGGVLAQVAGVCLELQGHSPGILLRVAGIISGLYALNWPPIDDQARRTWADRQEATEYGASAIAILLANRALGLAVIQRAVKGDGFDYWLGEAGEDPPFQNKARLEVSGILRSSGTVEKAVDSRVREKLKQIRVINGSLPAYVIVIEFGTPFGEVAKL